MGGPLSQVVGRRYDSGAAVCVEIDSATVADIRPVRHADSPLPWIAPGLVDLQINGYGGIELTSSELTTENVRQVVGSQDRFGVVRCCPTVTTHAEEVLCHALSTIARAVDELPEVAARFAGIHLEGPFISPEDGPRGAHPREHVRPPDWELFCRLQEAAGGHIRLLTLAPEGRAAIDLISRATRSGVRVALGHTAADHATISRAVDAGAVLSTHLGNGAHATLPRHPNYIWDQLAEDRLMASLIADGAHLPWSVLRSFIRAKQPHRCILVSDLAGTAGRPPGTYTTPLGQVELLPDGRIVVAGQRAYLAGAGLPIDRGVSHVLQYGGVTLAEAIAMASTAPATLLGLPPHGLRRGASADFVLFDRLPDGGIEVTGTIVRGERVAG